MIMFLMVECYIESLQPKSSFMRNTPKQSYEVISLRGLKEIMKFLVVPPSSQPCNSNLASVETLVQIKLNSMKNSILS